MIIKQQGYQDRIIKIEGDASLTIDEYSFMYSELSCIIRNDVVVTILNSTVMGECSVIKANCNIVNSYVLLEGNVIDEPINAVDCTYSNLEYKELKLDIKPEETLIVLTLNIIDFVKYLPKREVVILNLIRIYHDIDVYVTNVKKYHLAYSKSNNGFSYIVLIGDSNMTISRINKNVKEEYASDDELKEIKQKYQKILYTDTYTNGKNILTGIKYLQDHPKCTDEQEFKEVFFDIIRQKVINVGKGAKLFINGIVCFSYYYIDVKENEITSLDSCYDYHVGNDIYSPLLPLFLMKLLINHETTEFNFPSIYYNFRDPLKNVKEIMNSQK